MKKRICQAEGCDEDISKLWHSKKYCLETNCVQKKNRESMNKANKKKKVKEKG